MLEPKSVRNVTYIVFFVIMGSHFRAKKCPKRYAYSVFVIMESHFRAKKCPKYYVYSVFCDYGVSC